MQRACGGGVTGHTTGDISSGARHSPPPRAAGQHTHHTLHRTAQHCTAPHSTAPPQRRRHLKATVQRHTSACSGCCASGMYVMACGVGGEGRCVEEGVDRGSGIRSCVGGGCGGERGGGMASDATTTGGGSSAAKAAREQLQPQPQPPPHLSGQVAAAVDHQAPGLARVQPARVARVGPAVHFRQ